MEEVVKEVARFCTSGLELAGIAMIAGAAVYALTALIPALRSESEQSVADQVRRRLGVGVLLGLELLVGADIIYTVAIELTYESVGVLAIVVLIRTLLSFTLEVEMYGRWPWQHRKPEAGGTSGEHSRD